MFNDNLLGQTQQNVWFDTIADDFTDHLLCREELSTEAEYSKKDYKCWTLFKRKKRFEIYAPFNKSTTEQKS